MLPWRSCSSRHFLHRWLVGWQMMRWVTLENTNTDANANTNWNASTYKKVPSQMINPLTNDEMSDPGKYTTQAFSTCGQTSRHKCRINSTHSMNCSMDITCSLSLYVELNFNQQLEHPSLRWHHNFLPMLQSECRQIHITVLWLVSGRCVLFSERCSLVSS